MKQYLDLLRDILENGTWKEPARPGMPRTKEVFGRMMKFDLQEGFPLLTTKKMFFKGIVGELLWFLKGDVNIKYLIDNGINIWTPDAYKYYLRLCKKYGFVEITKDKFIDIIKSAEKDVYIPHPLNIHGNPTWYKYGDCGNIYGRQWCGWEGHVNQIKTVIENIKTNPDSRYHVITAWNPTDFLPNATDISKDSAALPACHMLVQLSVRDGYLDLNMIQRSCDTFLGVPFNIASYALLTHLIALECNLLPGVFTWFGNSVHIYENHIDTINEQLKREPYKLPNLVMFTDKKDIDKYEINDIGVDMYISHPAIKAELSVGI